MVKKKENTKRAKLIYENYFKSHKEFIFVLQAPFDNRRLVFPILPAALTVKVLLMIYSMVFSQTTLYFIIAGTLTGTAIKVHLIILL